MTLFSKRALMSLVVCTSVLVPTLASASPSFFRPRINEHRTRPTCVPELSAAAGGSSLALLAGAALLVSGKRRRISVAARSN